MKKAWKAAAACAAALCASVCTAVGVAGRMTCDSYHVTPGMTLSWNQGMISARPAEALAASGGASTRYQAELMLFDAIPVKTISVSVVPELQVIPGGTPFGIKMFTDGVMVVGLSEIQTKDGMRNPGEEAGLRMGDVLVSVGGVEVNRNEEVAALMEQSGGKPVELRYVRENKEASATLTPVKSLVDGRFKAGLWVRDSTAGIGTVTYYDPATMQFGGLGHGVCDTDTSELMPFLSGEILPVTISGVTKGAPGAPGELHGYFAGDEAIGVMDANDAAGVYGSLYAPPAGESGPVALRQEVSPGEAQIISTVDGEGPQTYRVILEYVNYLDSGEGKNLIVRVTDPVLLEKTGGIVQGMSGSPILQNGKLVGAVTHVFVNDPTRGYGIFAENMLEAAG